MIQPIGKRDIEVMTPIPKRSDFPLLFTDDVKRESFVHGDATMGLLGFNPIVATPTGARKPNANAVHSSFCQKTEIKDASHVPELLSYVLHLPRLKTQKNELPFIDFLDVDNRGITFNTPHTSRCPDKNEKSVCVCSVAPIRPDEEGKAVLRKVWKHKWKEKLQVDHESVLPQHLLILSRTGSISFYFISIVFILFSSFII